MNHSPNSLKDTIRIMNCDLDAIGIIEFNDKYYVNESNIRSCMKEWGVESIDIVISNINEFYNIKDVNVISEANDDLDLQFINEVMSLLEIDAKEVIKTADGMNALTMYIDQAAALILKHKYDKPTELKKYIARCDRVLDDIAEEKKVAKKKGENDSYKFTAYYIYNLAKNIFSLFLAPLVMTKATIKWPAAVLKLFDGVGGKLFKGITSSGGVSPTVWKNIAKTGFKTGEIFIGGMPSDLKNLWLSVNDYEQLLNHYEYKIKTVKAGLQYQLKQIELKDQEMEKKKMLELKEEVLPSSNNVEVQYMSPAEIEGKKSLFNEEHDEEDKPKRVVLHDDDEDEEEKEDKKEDDHHDEKDEDDDEKEDHDDKEKDDDDDDEDEDDEKEKDDEEHKHHHHDHHDNHFDHHCYYSDHHDHEHHHHHDDEDEKPKHVEIAKPAVPVAPTPSEHLSPIEAINHARGLASNVLVTKFGDKYYIDIKDLKKYMDHNKSDNYDLAVDNIIQANDDPDFNRTSTKVLMSNGELDSYSSEDKEKLESASIEFEIYPDK